MIQIRYTRNLFLRFICVVYLFAFLSFYIQIPGLYGDDGVLPARSVLDERKHKTLSARVHYQPTLLWLAPYLGLDVQYMMDLLSLFGAFLAFTGFISQKFCTVPTLAGLWSLYFSLYQVGQVFMTSQWDNLLLEAGFLSLLLAPVFPGKRRGAKSVPSDNVSFWLIRWLLFRYLVSTYVSKLLGGCPKWWDLTALKHHYETMPLPTPLSWYSYHLPTWYLKLALIYAMVCELVLPFLYFAPVRSIRITGFTLQILLQICIVLTGNFNFRDILVFTLTLSLLDDQFFFGRSKREPSSTTSKIFKQLLNLAVHGAVLYGVYVYCGLKWTGSELDSTLMFTKKQFLEVVRQGIPITIFISVASLGLTVARALAYAVTESNSGILSKVIGTLVTLFYSLIAILIFTASTVPLTAFHKQTNSTVMPYMHIMHNRLARLQVVNSYNLYDRTIIPDSRHEIIIEGSNNLEGPWQDYYFHYKPGHLNHSLPFVAPYSPRLDWQFATAAKSTYMQQPWLMSLAYRLLQGQPEVLNLIDKQHSAFGKKPPTFVRGSLYKYEYTSWNQRWKEPWWRRERVSEYFPAFTKDNPTLLRYLYSANILTSESTQYKVNSTWKTILDNIRFVTNQFEPSILLWSIFTAGCAIIVTTTRSK